jgi:hypothetical protein
MSRPHAFSIAPHWLLRLLALVAMSAQLVVAFAPLAEGHDSGMASHVESGGSPAHFVHNEATCPACQARSIHGTTSRPEVPLLAVPVRATAATEVVDVTVFAGEYTQSNPRAPPLRV